MKECECKKLVNCSAHLRLPYFRGATYNSPIQEWYVCEECGEHFLVRPELLEQEGLAT